MSETTAVMATSAPQPRWHVSLTVLLVTGGIALFLAASPAQATVQSGPDPAADGQTTANPETADGEPTAGPELTGAQQETYQRLVTELMSPFCQGLVLKDCPSSGAARMREQVREWVAEGRGEEWITERLIEQYGEIVRGSPEFEGFGIVGWLAPFLALAGGLVVLVAFLRGRGVSPPGQTASAPTGPGTEPGPSGKDGESAGTDVDPDAIRRRVEAELEELED